MIAEAVEHLKYDKNDPVFEFSSDCIKNAPTLFYEHLATLFKSFLIHGHITSVLTLATLVPILKDKLGNICSSDNYRSIAISSLVLKIFDWVIILLYGDKLHLDQLQFSYQPNISTNMCTWMAVETIDYFTRNGSEMFVCAMDMSKAFDKVKHSLLFQKLIERGLPEIYIRLLVVIYCKQTATVQWNNKVSQQFPLSNGVKQGAVLSAILYCVYMDDLYKILRRRKYGCWIYGEFYGIVGYSDDLLLISPSLNALKEMLSTCDEYAKEHNLQFSTNINPIKSKTKCMNFLKVNRKIEDIELCSNKLPWVSKIKHLGCTITNNTDIMMNDAMQKRAIYTNRNNELVQEFHFAHPDSKIKINNIYNNSFYGSVLWNLFGNELVRLEKSWNISQRKMLGLPRKTHRYFIEPVSRSRHIIYSLYKRFIRFIHKIKCCKKPAMLNLLKIVKGDCRSRTGLNLRKLMLKTGVSQIDNVEVNDIDELVYNNIAEDDMWKINMLKELIEVIHGVKELPCMNGIEIKDVMEFITTS